MHNIYTYLTWVKIQLAQTVVSPVGDKNIRQVFSMAHYNNDFPVVCCWKFRLKNKTNRF